MSNDRDEARRNREERERQERERQEREHNPPSADLPGDPDEDY